MSEEVSETAKNVYDELIDQLRERIRPPTNDTPSLLIAAEEQRIMAANYSRFFSRVARIAKCPAGDEKDVLEALSDATALKDEEVEKVKMKRLSQFSKSDLFLALITKLIRRR